MNVEAYLKKKSAAVDKALLRVLPRANEHPSNLHEAMHWAVFPGGKRLRPVLVLAACEALGGREADAIDAACAAELIHSYSLVHDDLPCMDDDAERRGKPSCHVRFGEDTAVLAGDALLTLAFSVLFRTPAKKAHAPRRSAAAKILADASGSHGMVGGQAMDMEWDGRDPDLPTIEAINVKKTGALIAASCEAGAVLAGATEKQARALRGYGQAVGLLFQIADDIMDGQGYVRAVGRADALETARTLVSHAENRLKPLGTKAKTLSALARFAMERKN